jgi:3-oxoacyl-[acyl-carrier protein] reductase
LARDGWRVATCYRSSREAAEATLAEVEAAGAEGLTLQADVSDPAQAESLVAAVTERWGRIDALVHAAGPYREAKLLGETDAGWQAMLRGNLDSFFYVARRVAPAMAERGSGRIVAFTMASVDRTGANPVIPAHYVAKVGLLATVRCLAQELASSGVTVNAVAPGFVDSGSVPMDELAPMVRHVPADRLGTVDDCVGAVRYLLSEQAAYVTGTNLVVSGGWGL